MRLLHLRLSDPRHGLLQYHATTQRRKGHDVNVLHARAVRRAGRHLQPCQPQYHEACQQLLSCAHQPYSYDTYQIASYLLCGQNLVETFLDIQPHSSDVRYAQDYAYLLEYPETGRRMLPFAIGQIIQPHECHVSCDAMCLDECRAAVFGLVRKLPLTILDYLETANVVADVTVPFPM